MKSPLFLTPLLNLFGQASKDDSRCERQRRCCEPGASRTSHRRRERSSAKGTECDVLDFQAGGKSTAGWETYQIDNASTSEVRGLFEKLPYCAGQPAIDVGYCGNIANGVNQTIVMGT